MNKPVPPFSSRHYFKCAKVIDSAGTEFFRCETYTLATFFANLINDGLSHRKLRRLLGIK